VGQIFGIPGERGNHVLPHRLHWCSVITSMRSLYAYVDVKSLSASSLRVARGQPASAIWIYPDVAAR
jgi:hypothetical protein